MSDEEQMDRQRRGAGDRLNPEPSYVVVGRVRRPHGIRGEIRAEILTDYPERLGLRDDLYLAPPGTPDLIESYPLEASRPHKGLLLIKLGGVEDRDAAEELRGMLIQVPLEEAVPLEEDEYYHFQLMGMDVETDEGEWLGRVEDVIGSGAHDVYVVRGPRGEILMPAVEDVILSLNVESMRMVVRLLPGLLEENAA